MDLKIIILAAGKGTRMRSNLPKVLQPLAHKTLLAHVVSTAQTLNPVSVITVIGHGAERIRAEFQSTELNFVLQTEQKGTGHAVKQAESAWDDKDQVLILYGDVPLIRKETLTDLLSLINTQHPLALLTLNMQDPKGYGRIVRDVHHQVQAIVEEKDANIDEKAICEVNTGIMAVQGGLLKTWLSRLSNHNAQQEFYLTDIIGFCVEDGFSVATTQPLNEIEVLGVNDKRQLQDLERRYQRVQAENLMLQGVTLRDASRLEVRGDVSVASDVSLDVNVVMEGTVILEENVTIEANCVLKNVHIGAGTRVKAFSHLEDAVVGTDCEIGPYARLRPGTELAAGAKIGNFVETKNAKIGEGSKINHLSYVGDTLMGSGCNIGAGTITCNYDGVNKHQTWIGNQVFVGSDSQLVAPVRINDGATIGAGSTITREVPAHGLTLSRSKQLTVPGWVKPEKSPKTKDE